MRVTVATAPSPIVSWADAKAHLRISDDFEQATVEGYIAAATAWIDGPAGWLGRSLGVQVLETKLAGFPSCRLPYGPIIGIVSATYRDQANVAQTLDPSGYRLLSDGRIIAAGNGWPSVYADDEAVTLRYRTGYGKLNDADPPVWVNEGIPAPIRQAILLLVGQWWVTRSAVNVGNIVNEMPFAVEALLNPYRVYR